MSFSSEELGRLSYEELCAAERQAMQDEDAEAFEALRDELNERGWAHSNGKPDVSPLLSRRVVRAALGPRLKDCRERIKEERDFKQESAYWQGRADQTEVIARALLALSDDTPSPLREDES